MSERMTRQEAISHFNKNPPAKRLAIAKFPATVEQLREAFGRKDNAGDKQMGKELIKEVLVGCEIPAKEAEELCEGFFRVGGKTPKGTVNYEDFLQEIIRMLTYKAIRVLQFDLYEKDKTKGEYDKAHKVELTEVQKVLESTNIGPKEAEEQVTELQRVQVGKNVKAVTSKAIANWYFTKYYPDVSKAKPQGLKYAEARKYVESVLADVNKALADPKCKKEGSEEHTELSYHAGKLMGVMEFVMASLIDPDEESAKIFGDDTEFAKVTKVVEGCQAANVKL